MPDRINTLLCSNLEVNKWKSANNVVKWIGNIKDKHLYQSLIFEVKDFYPLNKESLFHEAF